MMRCLEEVEHLISATGKPMARPGKYRKWNNSNEMKLYKHDFIASLFVLLFGVGLAVLITDMGFKRNFFIGLFVA